MRKILLVIDMQKDFIDGALGTPEAVAIVDKVAAEIEKYPAGDVFATRDTHPANYLDTQEGRNLPVVHAALGSAEVIDKPTFGSVVLAEKMAALAEAEPLEITLVGLCTDICVVSNALLVKAFLPETPVRVIADCCAGVTPESHAAALQTMKMCQVEVV